jgi:RHH-type proline utilization regulon transcriptional repressor/proline dehydrogenase/delta 1-pyrroline-5-carboxylate dehydrogenase
MGEPLYEQLVPGGLPGLPDAVRRPCRVYAPVGTHDTLLAYLVRRLLENGANTSFVNRIADENLSLEELVADPADVVEAWARQEGGAGQPHPQIPMPAELLGARRNSRGLDLADESVLDRLNDALQASTRRPMEAGPMVDGPLTDADRTAQAVRNPAAVEDGVGTVRDAAPEDIAQALAAAQAAAAGWALRSPGERAAILEAAADRFEAGITGGAPELLPLIVREAGKTLGNAVGEVREAVDFLRYYAQQLRRDAEHGATVPLGVVVCISPWNFPLAIFTGQVAAALAAGNVVVAKPAEQTPLVAAWAVRALWAAGVPAGALQLLPGRGETVGAALVAHPATQAVLFTGSTAVARLLQAQLAQRLDARGRPVTLVAETGGQNAMVVDSSALAEQAVGDIVSSAFDSAGQRCSALRLLCVQDDVADRVLELLRGAVAEWRIGDPRQLATDIGPVIDEDARAGIEAHVAACAARGLSVWRAPLPAGLTGCFVAPTIIQLRDIRELGAEVFGPVLHVLRYRRDALPALLEAVAATGYGLTQGVHTRIDETVATVVNASRAGNVYVNRNIVGAVVGVQPFGGEGLSGTGPKAGGPLYLLRLLAERPLQAARLAVGRSGPPARRLARGLDRDDDAQERRDALPALRQWAQQHGHAALAAACDHAAAESPVCPWLQLPGPTGEANLYAVHARGLVLCSTEPGPQADADRLVQLAAVLAVGSRALWPAEANPLAERLPPAVREHVTLARDPLAAELPLAAALHHGGPASTRSLSESLARRPGPIVTLTGLRPGEARVPLERLVAERSLSLNTAAAGGNASLMTLS